MHRSDHLRIPHLDFLSEGRCKVPDTEPTDYFGEAEGGGA